jgi:hypothetical protein
VSEWSFKPSSCQKIPSSSNIRLGGKRLAVSNPSLF